MQTRINDAGKKDLICTGWGIATLLFVWCLIALGVGHAGLLRATSAPLIGALVACLTILALVPVSLVPPMRRWVARVDLRVFVWFQLVRLVGVLLLYYHGQGLLPRDSAVPGGWEGIAVALGALVVATVVLPLRDRDWRWWTLSGWNLIGLADILLTVGWGVRAGLADPESLVAITELPLSLLPTFLVPLIIASHLIILARWWAFRGHGGAGSD